MSDLTAAWDAALDTAAHGLDLTDAEDRATFRTRVADMSEFTKTHVFVEVLTHLDPARPAPRTAAARIRAIADAYIAKKI